jgi:hypothetical protein
MLRSFSPLAKTSVYFERLYSAQDVYVLDLSRIVLLDGASGEPSQRRSLFFSFERPSGDAVGCSVVRGQESRKPSRI